MLLLICVAYLAVAAQSSCERADAFQCSSSLCSTHSWRGGICSLNASSTCLKGLQVPSGPICITCSGLPETACGSTCPDHYFNPTTNTCTNCATSFGAACIACDAQKCLRCAHSSGLVLSLNSKKCVQASANLRATQTQQMRSLAATNCAKADEFQCVSSVCPQYNYQANGVCTLNSGSSCNIAGRVPVNGVCTVCSGLSALLCTGTCPDHFYTGGSCQSCQSLFGAGCLRCNAIQCLACGYSNNLVLAAKGTGCVQNSCPNPNCLVCYQGGARCAQCFAGFEVTTEFTCAASTCGVAHCVRCFNSTCGNCEGGYELANSASSCQAVCRDDLLCVDCIAPGICGTCTTGFSPNAEGKCASDCSSISVSNCAECTNSFTCTRCNSGFNLVGNGGACVAAPAVANCLISVVGDSSTCQSCKPGYDLSADRLSCTNSTCFIDYCQTCSKGACLTCISGFIKNLGRCISSCSVSDCLFCINSTNCRVCQGGYVLNSTTGQCNLICSGISNCVSCLTTSTCASCAEGFKPSYDRKSCVAVCKARGCLTCADPAVCTACNTTGGFTLEAGVCTKNCPVGQFEVSLAGTCQVCNESINYCAECRFQIGQFFPACTKCLTGYFINGFRCTLCSSPLPNCTVCSSATQCDVCDPGLKAVDGGCFNPDCSVANCYVCKTTNVGLCHKCNAGYVLNSTGQCNRAVCANSQVFDSDQNMCVCPVGTYKIGTSCAPCDDSHCHRCTINTCLDCVAGYYALANTCLNCIDNCHTCHSSNTCDQCFEGYSLASDGTCHTYGLAQPAAFVDINTVYRCPVGCSSCIVGTSQRVKVVCLTPDPRYTIIGGEALRCNLNCLRCLGLSPSFCSECFPGYALVAGSCVACADKNAATCSPINVAYSLTCIQGYTAGFFNGVGGICYSCAEHCLQCDASGSGNCDRGRCETGYVVELGNTYCTKCNGGCAVCSESDLSICLDCGQGTYTDGVGCVACPPGCATCTSSSTCTSCELGYILDGTTCSIGVLNCKAITANACSGCFSGYSLNNNTCEPDVTCTTNANCLTCPDLYYLVNLTCLACSVPTGNANCVACRIENTSLCTGCKDGYYLDASNVCQPCRDNCRNCDLPMITHRTPLGFLVLKNACESCVVGYVLDSQHHCNFECRTNIAYCETCLNLSICTGCFPGHHLVYNGTLCSPSCTDTNCHVCQTASVCTECNAGYALNNASCSQIECQIKHCTTCSSLTSCSACSAGYVVSDGMCVNACSVTNCLVCDDATTCSRCNPGYIRDNATTCTSICSITNCRTCSSSLTCALCNQGFKLSMDNATCTQDCKVQYCATCTNFNTCGTCLTGFSLLNSSCVPQCQNGSVNTGTPEAPTCARCSASIANCETCTSTTVCTQCSVAYYLSSNAASCLKCSDNIPNCYSCASATNCLSCAANFFLASQTSCVASGCASTVQNCLYCASNARICTTCANKFLNVRGTCQINCPDTFIFDTHTGDCGCPHGTYLRDQECHACQWHCDQCDLIRCHRCDAGFYPTGAGCLACADHCLTCADNTFCHQCNHGYYSMNGVCQAVSLSTSVPLAYSHVDGSVRRCHYGCEECEVTVGGNTVCFKTHEGYSLVAGIVILCDSKCKTCSGPSSSQCTSCYMGSLRGGICTSCDDNNALDCIPTSTGFASHCSSGYTATFYISSNPNITKVQAGGTCMACAPYCHKCDQNGPGNCDPEECYQGFVQLRGTMNCTQCLGACARCDRIDPNVCLECPVHMYLDSVNGTCKGCEANCHSCTDMVNCTECEQGYQLINGNCSLIPTGCVRLDNSLVCAACYFGFTVQNSACAISTACNSSSNCTDCGDKQYLSTQNQCIPCATLPTNCIGCSSLDSSKCTRCSDGFYVANNTCRACTFGCQRCTSTDYCTKSRDGYLLVHLADMTESGFVKRCQFPCVTCTKNYRYCTSCFTDYSLNGTKCIFDSNVSLTLTLGTDANISQPIAITKFGAITNANRLKRTLCDKLPNIYFGFITTDAQCLETITLNVLTDPAITLLATISGGSYSNATQAENSILQTFAANTMLDGVKVLTVSASATNYTDKCYQADLIECISSYCPAFYYLNGACLFNASLESVCNIPGRVYTNETCVDCTTLQSNNCSSLCTDFIYTKGACTSCQSLFGPKCVKCSANKCLVCAESSILSLASDQKSCINRICALQNCRACYQGGSKCFLCLSGFALTGTFTCQPSSCSVIHCRTCSTISNTTCLSCRAGYSLSVNGTSCEPVCSDVNCQTCIAPGICGTCNGIYLPNGQGICTIDCTQTNIPNCLTCLNEVTCRVCNANFTLLPDGSACVPTCQVANCQRCVANSTTTCARCLRGFNVVSGGSSCAQSFCYIQYCSTCATFSTCSACITNFTLSTDNKTCTSNCANASISNCLYCSGTACTTCMDGYIVNATTGQCQLPCQTISNCVRCISTTQCASCAAGYRLSADKNTCNIVCLVRGCLSCPSRTSTTCTTCETGYRLRNGTCQRDCSAGQVATNSTANSVTCTNCRDALPFCDTCSLDTMEVIQCDNCLRGYFISGSTCDKCSDAIQNCLECLGPFTCRVCAFGFNVVGGLCSDSPCVGNVPNCDVCQLNNQTLCDRCEPGYILNSAFECVDAACPDTYIFNATLDACACALGTYESGSVCLPCSDSNCEICTISSCSSCVQGYFPIGSTCQKCLPNCQSCSSGSQCDLCERGYSRSADGTCFSFGIGKDVLPGPQNNFYLCPPGCRICVYGFSATARVICILPADGYSLVGGRLIKCDPSCASCDSYVPNLCTSCFPRFTLLSGGLCQPCGDPKALTCSPFNTNFTFTCQSGYTATYANGTGGTCNRCADFCSRCDASGPGKCDEGKCRAGAVQLIGTQNCTLCFDGCVRCQPSDPQSCIDCGLRRYLPAGDSTCQRCGTGCKTCFNTSTNCQSCEKGFWLVNSTCIAVPANCVGIDNSTGNCWGCFVGYVLQGTNNCVPDLTCNNTVCESCPTGFYLLNQKCFGCGLPSNCISCEASTPSACSECNPGFYVNENFTCTGCSQNCSTCDSADFCVRASDGFFVNISFTGGYTGEVAPCRAPCATCIDYEDFCLSCQTGFSLYGATCRDNDYLTVLLIIGPGASANRIFSAGDSANQQLFLSLRALNRLGNAIDSILPAGFRTSEDWRYRLRFSSFSTGSVATNFNVEAGSYTNGNKAKSDLSNALANGVDGASVVSSSITTNGFQDSNEDDGGSTNLGLILGLAIGIPVLIILIIIIVCCIKKRRDSTTRGADYEEPKYNHNNALGSEEVIRNKQHL